MNNFLCSTEKVVRAYLLDIEFTFQYFGALENSCTHTHKFHICAYVPNKFVRVVCVCLHISHTQRRNALFCIRSMLI